MIESDYLTDSSVLMEKLKQMPALEFLNAENLKGALKLSKMREYDSGESILEEGSYDNRIFFLVSGKVKIEKNGKELSVLERAGDVFGEMGVIDGSARSASAYAIDKTVCLATDISYVDRLSGNDKVAFGYILYRIFSESLAHRLRLTSERLIKANAEIMKLKSQITAKFNSADADEAVLL